MSLLFLTFFLVLCFVIVELSHLSFLFLLTFVFVFCLVTLVHSSDSRSLLGFLLMSTITIALILVVTRSLLVFFLMYELSLFPVLFIVIFFGYQPEKLSSSNYLLVYTIVCSSPLLFVAVSSFASVTTGFSGLSTYSCFLVLLSFIVNSPLYGLHAWLPKAHVEAPLVGSMVLAGVILKLGSFGVLLLSPHLIFAGSIFVFLTLFGGVVCSWLCFCSWDVKSLVAYSSIVHMGSITLGALSGCELGYWVSAGIVIGHSLLSPLLFVLANELYLSFGSRSFIFGFNCSSNPTLFLFLGLLSGVNFGLPPFLGFWVEVSLFSLQGSLFFFSLFPLAFASLLTFVYCVIFYAFSCGGFPSPRLGTISSLYIYISPLFLLLLIPVSPSISNF